MIDRIVGWFKANWKPIGYTIGIINIVGGLADVITGSMIGIVWILLGSFIVHDAWTSN